MAGLKKLPIGIENFEEMRREDFYYVDKSHVIEQLLTQLKKKEMTNDSLVYSIRELTELLEKHYGSKVIVLIDEYDVPLARANENGYYDEMVLLIRNLFENALKTNSSLKFAVLTGCLRIAKESIFTGLNNFNNRSKNSLTSIGTPLKKWS